MVNCRHFTGRKALSGRKKRGPFRPRRLCFVFEIFPGPFVLGKAALRFRPDDGLDDQTRQQDQCDDYPAEDDIARHRVIIRLSVNTAITDEVDQIPYEQAAEECRRKGLDGWQEPPSRHLEVLGVPVDLVEDLRRLEEPAGHDHLEDTCQDEREAVDVMVYDIEDRKARTCHVDQANDALNDAERERRSLLIEMELIRDRCRDTLDDGEQRVDRQRDQAEVEDEGEDHVDDTAVGKLDDRLRIDDKSCLDAGIGHIVQHADTCHGREHNDTGEHADDQVRESNDDRIDRDVCFFVEERTVREHDGHRCRQGVEYLADRIDPEIGVRKCAPLRNEELRDTIHSSGHRETSDRHDQKADNREGYSILNDFSDRCRTVADADIAEDPRDQEADQDRPCEGRKPGSRACCLDGLRPQGACF